MENLNKNMVSDERRCVREFARVIMNERNAQEVNQIVHYYRIGLLSIKDAMKALSEC